MKELITRTTNKIKDKGGPVMLNSKVQLIFWGNWNDPSVDPSKEKIETAIQHIIDSEYYSKLYQYRKIHKPAYLGSVVNNTSHLPHEFEDKDLKIAIKDSIDNGSVPDFRTFTNGQIMYIVITTRGHIDRDDFDDDGKQEGDAFHDNFKYKGNNNGVYALYYGYENKVRTLEGVTRALAHEIAEMCTDPGPDNAFVGPKRDKKKRVEK